MVHVSVRVRDQYGCSFEFDIPPVSITRDTTSVAMLINALQSIIESTELDRDGAAAAQRESERSESSACVTLSDAQHDEHRRSANSSDECSEHPCHRLHRLIARSTTMDTGE